MRLLASILYDREQERIESEYGENRRSQVGSGMRNERIRTYKHTWLPASARSSMVFSRVPSRSKMICVYMASASLR